MIARTLPPHPTLADRFGNLLYWLFDGMASDWRRRGVTHVHHAEISLRAQGLWKRVHSVLERYRAGTLRARAQVSHPHPNPPPQAREREKARKAGWCAVLPRGFGWLKRLFSLESVYHVNAFYPLLHDDAEMQAVIAAAPQQIGRALRPFCHLLGLEVPAALRLPKRVRVRRNRPSPRLWSASRPKPTRGEGEDTPTPALPRLAGEGEEDTSPRPSPHSGEGVWARRDARAELIIPNRRLPPREQAEDAMRRSEASGKAIYLPGFSAEALGWFLHWPRDGNYPPPKIGYGGRLRPLPKDYKPPKDDE